MRHAIRVVGIILAFSAAINAGDEHSGSAARDPIELQGFVGGVMEAPQKALSTSPVQWLWWFRADR